MEHTPFVDARPWGHKALTPQTVKPGSKRQSLSRNPAIQQSTQFALGVNPIESCGFCQIALC
jgi:hypothetical protein